MEPTSVNCRTVFLTLGRCIPQGVQKLKKKYKNGYRPSVRAVRAGKLS